MAADVTSLVATLAERGMKHLYIDGGQTIQAFLDAGLVNELIITRYPGFTRARDPTLQPDRSRT